MVLCLVYTIFTNVTNLCNIFLIFYDYLNFCSFTIFGSIKFAVEYFITSTLYFTKSVIYLRDIVVSTKDPFQIRLTLISNSSDFKNMIALFVFSFNSFIPVATTQNRFKVESLYINNLLIL